MKNTVILLATIASFSVFAETSLKLEGRCNGTLRDNTPVSFSYYSSYDGCHNKSAAALVYTSGLEGLFTGNRTLARQDIYSFDVAKLIFANSTGNTSGIFKYKTGRTIQSIDVQCEIRDYEYGECQ